MMSIVTIQCRFLYSVTQRAMNSAVVELFLDIHCYGITFWMKNHRHLCIKLFSKSRFVQKKMAEKILFFNLPKSSSSSTSSSSDCVICCILLSWQSKPSMSKKMSSSALEYRCCTLSGVECLIFVACWIKKRNNQIQTFIFF